MDDGRRTAGIVRRRNPVTAIGHDSEHFLSGLVTWGLTVRPGWLNFVLQSNSIWGPAMRIEDALSQVRTIQIQVARTERFCCYQAATVATSGLLAVVAALVQPYWIAEPKQQPARYLLLWVLVATLSVTLVGAEMLVRWCRTNSGHARRQTILALRQFTPCLLAGALLTWAILQSAPESVALLPALWSVVFSLGIFASSNHLPVGSVALAVYYLVAGLACIRWGQGDQALEPWTMASTFGVGQLLAAFVLYRQQERHDAEG